MNRKVKRAMAFTRVSSLVLALVTLVGVGNGYAGNPQKFLKLITSKGFQYNEGSLIFPDIIEMCCNCELPSCWGNNPSSTYGMYLLPAAPGQTALNSLAESFSTPAQPNRSICWRLRADEAIVFIGKTPPEMTYFGFASYLYDRAGIPPSSPPCPLLPSIENRSKELFSSLHDTLNNLTLKHSGHPWDPFSKETIIISAADKGIASTVQHALVQAGYPPNMINIDVIPSEFLNLGIEQSSDTLQVWLRMATENPDSEAVQDYMENPGSLWRLTPVEVTPPDRLDPYSTPKLRVRGTGKTELNLLPVIEDLRQAILDTYTSEYEARELSTMNLMEGYNCIQRNESCLGDNRDSAYIFVIPTQAFTLGGDDFVIAYGVNHAATGKATYSSFTVTGGALNVGAVSVRNDQFSGSAQYYLQGDEDVLNKLYAWKIKRENQCSNEPFCVEVKYDCQIGGIPADQEMSVAARAYLETSTSVGPAYQELVLDRFIKFTHPLH